MSHHAVDDHTSEGSIFYRRALDVLTEGGVPFLVGGAYALECHTGIVRRTKDFDIFMLRENVQRALDVLSREGFYTELTFPHWLAKAYAGDDLLDIIFNSGNGLCPVDKEWFEHAMQGSVLGLELPLCPAEETIWQKAFILERDRSDAADVSHLLRARAATLDWKRLLRRFGDRWRVLYAHLVLFGFVYPSHRDDIPGWVMDELAKRLQQESASPAPDEPLCQGTLLSATQYLRDIQEEGYLDARLKEHGGNVTPEDLAEWTANFKPQ